MISKQQRKGRILMFRMFLMQEIDNGIIHLKVARNTGFIRAQFHHF